MTRTIYLLLALHAPFHKFCSCTIIGMKQLFSVPKYISSKSLESCHKIISSENNQSIEMDLANISS